MASFIVTAALHASGIAESDRFNAAEAAIEPESIRIGVLAHRGGADMHDRWAQTAEFLSDSIPEYKFVVLPYNHDNIKIAVASNELDFVLTNPASYATLEAEFGMSRLVTLRNQRGDGDYTQFGALIITRQDNPKIRSIEDLKGKSFMAVHPDAFGGWWMAWREMLTHGVDPYQDLADLRFGGFPQDQVVMAVRNGNVDAGTVRTDILESMDQDGVINKNEFRVVNEKFTAGFPFSHSTKLYPEWPFAVSRHVKAELAERVAIALLNMESSSPAAIQAGIAGWTVPLDYQPVHDLMRELKVGPYRSLRKVTFSMVLKQYAIWFVIVSVLVTCLIAMVVYTSHLNRGLRHSKKQLLQEMEERKKAEHKSARLGRLIDSSSNEIIIFDQVALKIIQVNEGLQNNSGIPRQQLQNMTFLELQKEMSREKFEEIARPLRDKNIQQTNFETRFVRADETQYYVEVWMQNSEIDGKPVYMAVCEDVTARKLAERAIHEAHQKAEVTLESIADAVITTDIKGSVTYLNNVAEQLTGWRKQEALGLPLINIVRLISELTNEPVPDPIVRCINKGSYTDLGSSTLLLGRNGMSTPVQQSVSSLRDIDGNLIGVAMVLRDITELYRLQLELKYYATHDDLTRLINRREFQNKLQIELNSIGQRKTDTIALLYLDLDQFKVINDSCGHFAGDELLKQLAAQLQQSVRSTDVVARLGGDEFAILLEAGCDERSVAEISRKIIKTVNEYRFSWQEKVFQIGVSIGIVLIAESGNEINEVLAMADSACYVAKDLGRNRYYIYNPDDETLLRHRGEMQWVQQIKNSLDLNKFCLFAQPVQRVAGSGTISGFHEILLRMIDASGELISPEMFIPAAERYQLMPSIDRWVIKSTFRFISDYSESIDSSQRFSINISGQSLSDVAFVDFVKREIQATGVSPSILIFEITETSAISHFRRARSFIDFMNKMGCQFALDDFGSGMSSFSYLKNLPVQYLKIDGSFITGIVNNKEDYVMVKAMNQIGHAMGMKTIAEFVENEQIFQKLVEIGVDLAQGYAINKPQTLADYLPQLSSRDNSGLRESNSPRIYKKA